MAVSCICVELANIIAGYCNKLHGLAGGKPVATDGVAMQAHKTTMQISKFYYLSSYRWL